MQAVATIPKVPAGDYTAVVERCVGKYARSKSVMFSLTNTAYSGLIIALSAPIANGYPVFVISGTSASSENYYIYEKKSDGSEFKPFKNSKCD